MSRQKKRHHRKINQQRSVVQINQSEDSQTTSETTQLDSLAMDNNQMVKHDLVATLVATGILIALLFILSYINIHSHWTDAVGKSIYTLLHIR